MVTIIGIPPHRKKVGNPLNKKQNKSTVTLRIKVKWIKCLES